MPKEHLPPNVLNVFESKRKIRAKSGQGTKKHDVKQLQHTADPSTSEGIAVMGGVRISMVALLQAFGEMVALP